MNRAARRREQRIKKEEKNVMTLTQEQLWEFVASERNMATNNAIDMVASIACIVLKDKYGFGKKRMNDFLRDMMVHFELISEGEEKLGDIINELWDIVPPGTFSKEWRNDGKPNENNK